jgi:HAMP domain-containing protein
MFSYIFDQKLQNEVAETVRSKVTTLVGGIAARPNAAVTIDEVRALESSINNDSRIEGIVYLNPDASIRWYKTPGMGGSARDSFLGISYDEARANGVFPTGAVSQAFSRQAPRVVMFGEGNYYDMAFPLIGSNNILAGVISLQVSRASTRALIYDTIVNYFLGAMLVMIVMGAVLYVFVYFKILVPLSDLARAVKAVSLRDLRLHYPRRKDEINDVAQNVADLLAKIKEEFRGSKESVKLRKDKEQLWWQALLSVSVGKGARALVVDNENNIMFTNFELTVEKEGPVHLLDVFSGEQKELIEILGKAMDNPGKVFKGRTETGKKQLLIKAVRLPGASEDAKTMIVLEPEA